MGQTARAGTNAVFIGGYRRCGGNVRNDASHSPQDEAQAVYAGITADYRCSLCNLLYMVTKKAPDGRFFNATVYPTKSFNAWIFAGSVPSGAKVTVCALLPVKKRYQQRPAK